MMGMTATPTMSKIDSHRTRRRAIQLRLTNVVYRLVRELRKAPGNARKHPQFQIDLVAASIKEYGFLSPLLIDEHDRILAGHGRLEAAKSLDIKRVPTIQISHLSKAQKRAYRIADNRLTELSVWDEQLLARELKAISELDINYNLDLTGFDSIDVDRLLHPESELDPAAEALPAPDLAQPPVSRADDIWQLGGHRLICGDARDPRTYRKLMAGRLATLVIDDFPYNVPIANHVVTRGSRGHREFAMASGEMTKEEFCRFIDETLRNLIKFSIDGSIHYHFADWRMAFDFVAVANNHYSEMKNLCVWHKTNAGMGSFYRSAHELILVFKHGTAKHINNFGLGARSRYRTNVWTAPGANVPGSSANKMHKHHPTPKPVSLVADAIRDCSRRGDIVLDAFAGSGTVFVAAETTGRSARGIEIDPIYVDLAVRRWEKFTGQKATLAETRQTFSETRHERSSGGSQEAEPRRRRRKMRHAA
jgi:DNA modification methylase